MFTRLPFVTKVLRVTSGAAMVSTERGAVTLHFTTPEHAGAALVWHTGSRAAHGRACRRERVSAA